MKVTPVNKKFGKYKPGEPFDFPDKAAKVFIKVGRLAQALDAPALTQASQKYSTRMMHAEPAAWPGATVVVVDPAPYGYKADGTPRKRPGRMKASE